MATHGSTHVNMVKASDGKTFISSLLIVYFALSINYLSRGYAVWTPIIAAYRPYTLKQFTGSSKCEQNQNASLTPAIGCNKLHVTFLNKLNQKERAVEEVRLALRPYYHKQDIGKEDYKEIMRKAVPKICKASEINPVKVKSFIEAYVKKCKFERMKRSTLPSSTT
ncbi:Splicing factor, arginine/serine-rich 19 [Nymphon striatum]|nr:Splicing factor, arginine/serine-rich 19 [Nymphon striatum]